MNRRGFWINVENEECYEVYTHDQWMREEENARKVNTPENVIQQISTMQTINNENADKIRLLALYHCEIIRFRGHDDFVVFEFATSMENFERYLGVIKRFLESDSSGVGEFTMIHIYNLQENQSLFFRYNDPNGVTYSKAKIEYRSKESQIFAENLFNSQNDDETCECARCEKTLSFKNDDIYSDPIDCGMILCVDCYGETAEKV
jgi:hypothetical protein